MNILEKAMDVKNISSEDNKEDIFDDYTIVDKENDRENAKCAEESNEQLNEEKLVRYDKFLKYSLQRGLKKIRSKKNYRINAKYKRVFYSYEKQEEFEAFFENEMFLGFSKKHTQTTFEVFLDFLGRSFETKFL